MVPGLVQGLSRVPPDHPGGGGGGGLYSGGLWGKPEVQSPKSKVRGQQPGSARGTGVKAEGRMKNAEEPDKATQSHINATSKLPQSHLIATA
jgi:hypothetical protein